VSASIIITQQQFITNLYKWDACGRGFSDTIIPLSIAALVVASRRLSSGVSSAVADTG